MRMIDPTRDEMLYNLNYFYDEFGDSLEPNKIEFDIEASIYWFSNDYHQGQSSNLYEALSSSPYRPGQLETSESYRSDSEIGSEMYENLVNKYIVRGE